jgi:hypothetical protein
LGKPIDDGYFNIKRFLAGVNEFILSRSDFYKRENHCDNIMESSILRKMDEMLAYCGLICKGCPIYWATREKNKEKKEMMRAEIARIIKEQYGVDYKPGDITDCDGCKADNRRLFSGSKKCPIRKCARKKGLKNCAYCSDYACDKLKEFFRSDPSTKARLDVIRSRTVADNSIKAGSSRKI